MEAVQIDTPLNQPNQDSEPSVFRRASRKSLGTVEMGEVHMKEQIRSRKAMWVPLGVFVVVGTVALASLAISSETQERTQMRRSDSLWTHCADEGGNCQCSAEVRYGVDGKWTYQDPSDGVIGCNNDVFGDPAPGNAEKFCQCRQLQWEHCANEDGICECIGLVRYGANDVFVEKRATGSIACENSEFGDPIKDVKKACQCQASWFHCAKEGERCQCQGKARYGADNMYRFANSEEEIACDNTAFGGDPNKGVRKSCECNVAEYQHERASAGTTAGTYPGRWQECANEGESCSCGRQTSVRFGADGDYVTKTQSAQFISCGLDFFGEDPAPGVSKTCSCYHPPEPVQTGCRWQNGFPYGRVCICDGGLSGNADRDCGTDPCAQSAWC